MSLFKRESLSPRSLPTGAHDLSVRADMGPIRTALLCKESVLFPDFLNEPQILSFIHIFHF